MKINKIDYLSSSFYQDLYRSLKETGFAVVKNGPVNPDIVQLAYEEWKAFFATEEKHGYLHENQHGYFPFKSENAKDQTVADAKEFFHLYPGDRLPGVIPTNYSRILFELLEQTGLDFLGGIDAFYFMENRHKFGLVDMAAGSPSTLLRALHYPPNPNMEIRAAAHEDINLITLLPVSTAPGLQVQDRAGNWYDVEGDPGDIVVNAGDMLQYLSDGVMKSTTHRVITPADLRDRSRYSMAAFIHPKPETILSAGRTAQDFLEERLRAIGIKK